MQSRKDTRKSKPHSGWQEKSAIGACNERHPQSQYSVTRKSNNLSAKWLLSRKGYNPFGETSAFAPRLSRYPQNDFVKCVLPQGSIV